MERIIDGKYSAVIRPGKHQPTCNSNLVQGTECNCISGQPRVAIINTATGVEIPEDEPLILFRGKDTLVRGTVEFYRHECYTRRCRPEHTHAVEAELVKLHKFAREHPKRMKVPD